MRLLLRILFCLVSASIVLTPAAGSQPSEWEAHTSFRAVQDVAASDSEIWVASPGGVFRHDVTTGEIRSYTTVDGLHAVAVQSIAFDLEGEAAWLGYADGVIERLDASTGRINSYLDIARADQFTSRQINRITAAGNLLYIATGFGVVVWDTERNEVRESYTRFGVLPAATAVNDVLPAPLPDGQPGLWVALESGIAYAPLSASNLREPSVWTVEGSLPPGRSLGLLGTSVLVGTANDAFFRSGDGTWLPMGFGNSDVRRMVSAGGKTCVTTPFWFIVLDTSGNNVRILSDGFENLTGAVFGPEGNVWIGDRNQGLVQFSGIPANGVHTLSPSLSVLPEGPFHGLFSDIAVGPDGSLWATAIRSLNGGLYRLDPDGSWTDFRRETYPEMQDRYRLERVFVGDDLKVWSGGFNEGQGLLSLSSDTEFELFTQVNSSLRSVPGEPVSDIRISGIAESADGDLWVTNFLTTPRLHVRTSEGTWLGVDGVRDENGLSVNGDFTSVYVDSYDHIWLPLRFDRGVLVIDPKSTPTDFSDDDSRWFRGRGTGGIGLSGSQVNTVIEDGQGGIWIGTDRGLSTFVFGSLALDSDPAWPVREGAFVLRDLFVNDLAVDPANNLWIASREGAWQINAVTYETLAHYTSQNSPLFSDNVVGVEVDPASGRVFFATTDGLVSLKGTAISPVSESAPLKVYPNPARAEGGNIPTISIEGLVDEADVSIVTIAGDLVARFRSRGGRVTWDGKDQSGEWVPSGMYLVVAVGTSGQKAAYGKVAVIR